MLFGTDLDEFFGRVMKTLAPYLDDLVCIGGCANTLYRFHPMASPLPWGYIGTTDMDNPPKCWEIREVVAAGRIGGSIPSLATTSPLLSIRQRPVRA